MSINMEPHTSCVLLFGRSFGEAFRLHFRILLSRLASHGARVYIFNPFYEYVNEWIDEKLEIDGTFSSPADLPEDADFMLSIGGDGTFLEAVSYVRDKGIPVAGINAGRLGFLADIAQEAISKALDSILLGLYKVEERTLLELKSDQDLFGEFSFALNEITIHKRDDSSMIKLHAYLNDEFLNTYWADGLIVSTPTGSTAYSLSVGGPIVLPGIRDFIIAPIAPHNLTVRPLVFPDNMELKLRVEGRSGKVLVSLDSRSVVMETGLELRITKAPFKVLTIRLNDHSFYNTLRSKLMWGVDKRN
ncbi:MAG: NAD kinase [Bacteroidales bacterium]|nr:NAD kinase [Bacteroidales bacterium]